MIEKRRNMKGKETKKKGKRRLLWKEKDWRPRTWRNTNVEPDDMSESDELMEPLTSKEPDQSEEGKVNNDDTICCECNVSYEDDVGNSCGEEWVHCACKRWIHENCIDKVVIDADGKERFCSYCVV